MSIPASASVPSTGLSSSPAQRPISASSSCQPLAAGRPGQFSTLHYSAALPLWLLNSSQTPVPSPVPFSPSHPLSYPTKFSEALTSSLFILSLPLLLSRWTRKIHHEPSEYLPCPRLSSYSYTQLSPIPPEPCPSSVLTWLCSALLSHLHSFLRYVLDSVLPWVIGSSQRSRSIPKR